MPASAPICYATSPPTFVSVATAARILDVSKATIRRAILSGRLPAVRFARAVRIPADALRPVTVDQISQTEAAAS